MGIVDSVSLIGFLIGFLGICPFALPVLLAGFDHGSAPATAYH